MFSTLPGADVRLIPSLVLAAFVWVLLLVDRAYRPEDHVPGPSSPDQPDRLARVYGTLVGAAIGVGLVLIIRGVLRCTSPVQWHDARSFWAWGRMVWAGQDPYSQTAWQAYFGPGTPPTAILEDMNKGSAYPPPTQLLFAIVGGLSFQPAMIAWELIQFAALIATTWLLARMVLADRSTYALPFVFGLLLLLPGSWYTFDQGQTNYLAFTAILLAWRGRSHSRMGVWTACATCVKPVYHVYWLFPLLKKQWRVLLAGAGVVVVTAGTAAIVLGPSRFAEYFLRSPIERLDPNYYFLPPGNQSLLASIVRLSPSRIGHETLLLDPTFLTLAAVVLIVTVWLMHRAMGTEAGDEHAFLLLVPAALLLYPGTLIHYSVLLLFPLLTLWRRGTGIARWPKVFAAVVGALYGLMCWNFGDLTVLVNIGAWIIVIVSTLDVIRSVPRADPAPPLHVSA